MKRLSDEEVFAHAIVGGTDAAIRYQEAHGQQALVNSAALPKRCPRAELEQMGVVFGDDADDLFVNVALPAGWRKQATDHSMWSNLLDDQGRKRGAIFYKAAFYDRNAFMDLSRRINVTRDYCDDDTVAVLVKRDDETLFSTEPIKRDLKGRDYFVASDAAEQAAIAWADEHYPDWRSPLAYWD